MTPVQPGTKQLSAAAAAALLSMTLLGAAAAPADDEPADDPICIETDCGPNCQRAVDIARRHSAKYLNEGRALADGFVADPVCISVPGVGGMGFHYPNPERMADTEVDPASPEILLYAEREGGRRFLVGVEYFAPALSDGQPWFGSESEPPPSVDNPPPVLFGHTFDGPMPGHNPMMPWHYDLHVWAWTSNPAGQFVGFNPRVACP